jgi:CHAD domain-containing protein
MNLIVQAKQIVLNTRKVGISFDPDIIHDLRTGFKKIRALLRWQRIEKKEYNSFKETYDKAGGIRNIQVAEKMLKKENFISITFNDWLSGALMNLKEQWAAPVREKTAQQLLHNILELKAGFSKHKKFFERNIKNIHLAIRSNTITDTSIHDTRKRMKDMQYILLWWKKKRGKPMKGLKDISIKQLKELGEQIGAYNDMAMLIMLLKNYTGNKEVSANEVNMLARWEEERLSSRKKLISRISRLK